MFLSRRYSSRTHSTEAGYIICDLLSLNGAQSFRGAECALFVNHAPPTGVWTRQQDVVVVDGPSRQLLHEATTKTLHTRAWRRDDRRQNFLGGFLGLAEGLLKREAGHELALHQRNVLDAVATWDQG